MTLHEMWERMDPYVDSMYSSWISMSQKSLIKNEAFKIAFWKEVEYRMTNGDYDDCDDDVEGLDEVDPKFFFDQLKSTPIDDDHAAEIFIADNNMSYEYFMGLVNQIIEYWRERDDERHN